MVSTPVQQNQRLSVTYGTDGTKIASGQTTPGATNWESAVGPDGIRVKIDTSAAGFTLTPIYVTSSVGNAYLWGTTGAAVVNPTPQGFEVFMRWEKGFWDSNPLDIQEANSFKWHINWIALEHSSNLSHLANKEFYIRNRWNCEQNEPRCDKHLSFTGDTKVILASKDDTANLVPWKLVPVPGKTDEFYIRNRWHCQQNDPRCDKHLSFSGNNIKLYSKDDTANLIPWKLFPVPGKTDEFYIRNRWHCEQNDSRCDYHLSFTGDDLILVSKEDTANLVPWKLVPVN